MPPTLVRLLDSRPILAAGSRELIRLDTQACDLAPDLVARAREELLARDRGKTPGFRWGYFLGVEGEGGAAVSASRELRESVYEQVVAPVSHCRGAEFGFSFFKVADGRPPPVAEGVHYAGFHLDTHPEITSDEGIELLRVLVNVASTPRLLKFLPLDRFELARRGSPVERSDYHVVAPPPGTVSEVVEIPGFDGAAISYLTFWASAVPHVGVDTPAGYFVGSFEAPAASSAPWSECR